MLKLKDIKKNYYVTGQTIPALQGISLEFGTNEFVCILGPSGCGKTTLMNIIGGLDQATGGEICYNDISTKKFKDIDWDNYRNKKIGFVFQSYNLIPHASILANVALALTLSGATPAERHARAKEVLDRVGLSTEYNKKPNQLSGGQMQRVAIARAIINSPEVLLLDEPTGALDTQTSIQILDLIKEIGKDKLVIMVTHNSELAQMYGTRVIHMRDGLILSDSNPYYEKVKIVSSAAPRAQRSSIFKRDKTSMSFITALGLSLTNLLTKKGRTIMTSVAGSIGIIGIALILSLSNGMNLFISKMQTDTLAGYPITITTTAIDVAQAMKMMRQQSNSTVEYEKFPIVRKVFAEKSINIMDIISRNDITREYINYIETNLDKATYNDITYKTGLNLNAFGIKAGRSNYSKINISGDSIVSNPLSSGATWQMLLSEDFLSTQYDVLAGSMPSSKEDIVLIINESNHLFNQALDALFLRENRNVDAIDFDEIIDKKYKIFTNDELYKKVGNKYTERAESELDYDAALTVRISGILRIKKGIETGALIQGIGYTKGLYNWLQTENMNSEIIEWMKEEGNEKKSPLTGNNTENRDSIFRALGGNDIPDEINIYPVDFASKEVIKRTLDAYNTTSSNKIMYIDMSEIMGEMLKTFINIISWVLIAFTAISLIVSSIMISIITYVSVLERTKEIGILRAIGARKIDISRVFNAETFIIGLISGMVGVVIALLLTVPINMLTRTYLEVDKLAVLGLLSGAILILISIGLTVLSGLIPARKAAKKDPVLALRTE